MTSSENGVKGENALLGWGSCARIVRHVRARIGCCFQLAGPLMTSYPGSGSQGANLFFSFFLLARGDVWRLLNRWAIFSSYIAPSSCIPYTWRRPCKQSSLTLYSTCISPMTWNCIIKMQPSDGEQWTSRRRIRCK